MSIATFVPTKPKDPLKPPEVKPPISVYVGSAIDTVLKAALSCVSCVL